MDIVRDARSNKDVRKMLRKLDRDEHIKTRALWEEIFKEDSKEFLDYYYICKTTDNEIYVIEEDGEIVSMLHLNPYQMRIGTEIYSTHYIVAVATKEAYRKRGYMKALLEYAMGVMVERGEPFTFLMPAEEAIYKPFGFRYVYEQRHAEMNGIGYHADKADVRNVLYVSATESDCAEIAVFANKMLQKYEVVTWRDEMYYRTLLAELNSEAGGILLAKKDGELVGVFCYAETGEQGGPRFLIREPIWKESESQTLVRQAIFTLTQNETEYVSVIGIGDAKKPMIMAKILNPKLMGTFEDKSIFLNEVV